MNVTIGPYPPPRCREGWICRATLPPAISSFRREEDEVDAWRPDSLPPGYPEDYPRTVTLSDGRQVLIRPILPSDAPELGRAMQTADPDTLRRRFLGGPPPVTRALLCHLTEIDYAHRFALVAVDPATEAGVAIARYEQAGGDAAEIAVAVTPAWRRLGLATELISLLAEAALAHGIRTFTASYIAENRPVAALVKEAGGLGGQVIRQGIAEFSIALERDRAASQAAAQPGGAKPSAAGISPPASPQDGGPRGG